MADYIEDTGGDNYDALLSGTYTTDAANCTLTLGSDGEGDTGYVLPNDSSWVLVEIYDVEDVYGDLGIHKFNNDTSSVATYVEAVRTSGIAEYTTFKITATHYKGDGTADIYYGDESTATAVHNADIEYIQPVDNWIIAMNLATPLNELLICTESYDCGVTWLCPSYLGSELYTNGDNEAAVCLLSAARVTVAQSSTQSHAGAYSEKITLTAVSGARYAFSEVIVAGKKYYTEQWVYLPSGQNITEVAITEAGTILTGDPATAKTTVTDEWVKLYGTFTATYTKIGTKCTGDTEGDYWYVDDLSTKEVIGTIQ